MAFATIPEINKMTSDDRTTAFIIDDTPFYRDRSKQVEMLSWQYDHSEQKYYKGFNMLNMGWSDGQTFIPVDFRILSIGDDKKLLCQSRVTEDRRTLAAQRRADARKDKPALVLEMLNGVRCSAIDARYVLFDSWFATPSAILNIKRLGYDVVARLKNHPNYRYLYDGQCRSIKQIFSMSKKRPGRSRYLLSVKVEVRHENFSKSVPAKIVFLRDKNKRKNWVALISTDIGLSEEEIVALYGKRWDIEPYHKILKSYLRLTKEFQLRSFDAIVAHAAIVVTRYIFLAVESREEKDARSIGELYLVTCDELEDISFFQAFSVLMKALESYLCERFCLAEDAISEALSCFIRTLPPYFRDWSRCLV
jgi:hypothetical protein